MMTEVIAQSQSYCLC